jgi:predicted transcriptional regulator of viral defense system
MNATSLSEPTWQALYDVASTQEGLFTARQAASAGYSPPLLVHHQKAGRIARVRRGIYRLIHYPPGEHEELVTAWLWSESQGVISHQTALSLQSLSDVLPAQVHLTLPAAWRQRRFRIPDGVRLHFADVSPKERTWIDAVPMTSTPRTLNDCAVSGVSPDLLRQAAKQALARGLVTRSELDKVEEVLEPFGGMDE